jgi:phage virion morphogenesis protein
MTHELSALEDWAGGLLAPLDPAARRKLNLQVAQELRRSQQQRIKAQQTPEGIAYTPRKQRKEFRNKQGRIKKQKAAMFEKLRTNTHLKIKADANQIEVGFTGKVARIARVHQYGLRDKVSHTGPEVKYEERKLLGFSETDRELIRRSILKNF